MAGFSPHNEISVVAAESGFSGALFDQALVLWQRLDAEHDPEMDPDNAALFRAAIAGSEKFEQNTLLAIVDDAVVGVAGVAVYHLDTNQDQAELEIEVDPTHRRRGIGRALAQAAAELAEANGRTRVNAYNVNSPEALAFWASFGAERKSIGRQSRLWLAETDEAMIRQWVETRTDRASGYRLEWFEGITPVHLRAAAAKLNTDMNDAPTDDLEREPDIWSEDDVVALDELIIGRGRRRWTTIAFGPNDEPAGLTAVSIQNEKPRFAHQGNTVVAGQHRNRGLGRWLKADMWLRLRADAPHVEAIDTDNAESNTAMLAINEAMGFAPLVEWGVWQADTASLRLPKAQS